MSFVRIVSLVLALAFVGCTTLNTEWDLASQGDLAGRRSFSLNAIAENPGEFADVPQDEWAKRQKTVRALILTELTAKGYRLTNSSPDFLVRFVTGVQLKGGSYNYGDGQLLGELDIHASDPTSKRWLWHGWASETITRKLDRDAEVQKAVSEILAKFPPAS